MRTSNNILPAFCFNQFCQTGTDMWTVPQCTIFLGQLTVV